MNNTQLMSRRSFLKVATTTGAGLAIQIFLPGCTSPTPIPTDAHTLPPQPTLETEPTATGTPEPPAWLQPSVYLTIGNDGLVTITVNRSEMGQGVRTAFPMIVAEELGADWSSIRVEQAPADYMYGTQLTGGSNSIGTMYGPLRQAGALAREMLIAAAAVIWGVDKESCFTENGLVIHKATGQQLPFGSLVSQALAMPIPDAASVPLKPNTEALRILGTRVGHIEAPHIVTGRAIYGLDVRVPGMLYAVVARAPVIGGKVSSFDDAQAKDITGVRHVVQIDSGVAVVADNTWAAIKGRESLRVTWDDGPNGELNSADLAQTLFALTSGTLAADNGVLEATYEVPFMAHATMEPMNCVADVRPDECHIWVPTQNPMAVKQIAARLTGLPANAVNVNVTLLGGGFGRRLEGDLRLGPLPVGTDYAAEAVQISQAVGAPAQVVWTREDDIQHDIYHPLTAVYVRARLDNVKSLTTKRLSAQSSIPVGNWRAVTNVADAFARECFLDEFAAATGTDPLELRRKSLSSSAMALLDLAASKVGWDSALPEGHGRGIAYHATWGTTGVAMVAEVSVDRDGLVQVRRVVCAVDCGLVINPDGVEAQMEGGIIFGLTAALKGPITVEKGRVQQSNFHDYPLLRFDESPEIEIHIMPSTPASYPKGIGEMGNPVIMPAVANAVFAATGKRIRRLPIRAEDLRA